MSKTNGPAVERGSGATVVVRVVLFSSLVVSILHYTDNYLRFDRYALRPGGPVTAPTIPAAWVVFTVIGVIGYVMYRRDRWWPAVGCFAVYSISGLISLVHYTQGPPSAFDSLQNVLIATDIIAGFGVLGLALWLMLRRAVSSLAES